MEKPRRWICSPKCSSDPLIFGKTPSVSCTTIFKLVEWREILNCFSQTNYSPSYNILKWQFSCAQRDERFLVLRQHYRTVIFGLTFFQLWITHSKKTWSVSHANSLLKVRMVYFVSHRDSQNRNQLGSLKMGQVDRLTIRSPDRWTISHLNKGVFFPGETR